MKYIILLVIMIGYLYMPTHAQNRALNFDGTNDFVNIPTNGIFTAYTIEAWVKFNGGTTANQSVIVGTDGAGPFAAYSHQIRTDANGRFVHYTFDNVNGQRSVVSTTVAVTGRWYHVAITAENGGVSRLFVNGVEEGTPVAINTLWTGINRFHVGTGSGGIFVAPGANFLNGEVDEVRTWNYPRCAADIMATMNCELAGNEPSLRASYNFNQGVAGSNNAGLTTLTNNATSGATFDGTLTNFALNTTTSNWVASTNNVGSVCVPPTASTTGNRALTFDGVNDFVNTPTNGIFTAYTIEAWVKFNGGTTANQSVIVGTDDAGSFASYSHQIRTDGAGRFVHYTFDNVNDARSVVGTTVTVTGRWYHVAITAENGGVSRLFVNGVEEGTPVTINTLWTGINRFHVGTGAGGILIAPVANFLNGEVDEVRAWNYVRCAADIMATMNCSLAGNEPSLRASYNFNQGVAGSNNAGLTTLTNNATSGATFDGTLNNFTLFSCTSTNWVASTNNVSGNCGFTPTRAATIVLSNNSIAENNAVNAVVGALSMPTNNPCIRVMNYTLVPGQFDNALFNINNNNVRASVAFDFEARSSYQIFVRTTGSFGTSDQLLNINITNVIDANEIILSPEIAAKAGNREVTLTWATVPSANQYEIFMYSDNMPQTFVGNTEANTFNIKGLTNGVTYYFRVVALLTQFNIRSGFSNTVSARPSIVLGTEEETLNNQFKVYPNPNSGSFSLVIGELKGKNAQLTVWDLGGRILHQQNVATSGSLEAELNLNLASGMYLLQVSTDKENLRRKLLIER